MLTKLTIRNFKQFDEVEIPLDNGVVFIGPNNSGKSSALQALTLWHAGLHAWAGKRLTGNGNVPERRPGVTVHRRDLLPIPLTHANMMWRNRKTRESAKKNLRIDLIVEGVSSGKEWRCGMEFDYDSEDTFHCRPLRLDDKSAPARMPVPEEARAIKINMLPPMSGLTSDEPLHQDGRVNVLIGEGRTAEVLRNLCYRAAEIQGGGWEKMAVKISRLFGVSLQRPFMGARSEIVMEYEERGGGVVLDLQSAGRGMQQVLLLLAFLQLNPGSALLLDEPDAHLEILRQRAIYQTLLAAAEEKNSQIIAASHSEALLNEAVERNSAVAFVGKPHRLGRERQGEVLNALKMVGFDQYYHAETRGWVLYVEGASDISILRAFAEKINHPVRNFLEDQFVKYVGDAATDFPGEKAPKHILARRHFYALREAHPEFKGVLLVDGDVKGLDANAALVETQWRRREIENYICARQTLLNFAASNLGGDLWGTAEKERRCAAMEEQIKRLEDAAETTGDPSPFSGKVKASDKFLTPLFRNFAKALALPLALRKADFYKLVEFIPDNEMDPEIREKLDAIHEVAKKATD